MTLLPIRRIAVGCALAIGLGACAGSRPATAPSDNGLTPDRVAELEAAYRARQDEARSRFTQADVDFMTGMIAHHAQALVMSALAPENDAGPAVRTLCSRIINAQNDEIATMQNWLRERGQPVPEVHIDGLNLMVHGVGEHHMHMPGMLSQEQLEELAAARGPEFDRLFLTYMIQHHSGAVSMVDDLFASRGAGLDEASFKLASDINVDQTTEIARMQKMLDAMTEGDG